jgi:hypothetical protein
VCAPGAVATRSLRARLRGGSVVAVWRQCFVDELTGATGSVPARRSGVKLTRTVERHGGGGEVSGQRRLSVGREIWWPVAMEAQPCSVGVEEGR